jgi:hypothetical protein
MNVVGLELSCVTHSLLGDPVLSNFFRDGLRPFFHGVYTVVLGLLAVVLHYVYMLDPIFSAVSDFIHYIILIQIFPYVKISLFIPY